MNEIAQAINQAHRLKKSVSEKGVDWHIDHTLRVLIGVSSALKNSNPGAYKWRFNFARFYIFTRGAIPRGVGKAPKGVIPQEIIEIADLNAKLKQARELLKEIEFLPKNAHFKHDVFGVLNLKHAKRLLKLHTCHHLKIINDILEK